MKKNSKKIIIITLALLAIFGAWGGINSNAAGTFAKSNSRAPVTAFADKAAVKSAPLAIGFIKGSASGPIQISAENEGWCEIEYNKGGKIRRGFIKKSALTDQPYTENEITVSAIELASPEKPLAIGEQFAIEAEISPSDHNDEITWQSSNESVATVENGTITAIGAGRATITAAAQRAADSIVITVSAPESGIAFNLRSLELQAGEAADLSASLENADGEITWSTSNGDVATISGGKLRAKGAGLAIITAEQNGITAQCAISVTPISTHAKRALNMVNAYGDIYNYHPSVEYFADGWNGYKYWCAFTPYKSNDDQWENPHILASNDLKNWEEPSGFSNPLEPKPENYEHGKVYNSDTELVYNTDTGLLECWWRFYDRPSMQVKLLRKTTSDGVHWSDKEEMLVGEMYVYDFLSPAIIYEDGLYKMWAINQNTGYSIDYRESADGKSWSEIRKITVEYDDAELAHWHLDVIRSAKGYEMSISAYYPSTNDRVHMSLYYSYSPDNVTYTKAKTLFVPPSGTGAWDNMGLYRSSLLYAGGKYYLFYSGLNDSIGPSGMGVVGGNTPFTMKDING